MEPSMTNEYPTFELETLPHKSVLYQAAYSLLGSRGEAEDAVQEMDVLLDTSRKQLLRLVDASHLREEAHSNLTRS